MKKNKSMFPEHVSDFAEFAHNYTKLHPEEKNAFIIISATHTEEGYSVEGTTGGYGEAVMAAVKSLFENEGLKNYISQALRELAIEKLYKDMKGN